MRRRVSGIALDRYYTRRLHLQERRLIRFAGPHAPELFHFLYGESCFRTFKQARPQKTVLCSFHQPPEIMERSVTEPKRFGDLNGAIILAECQRSYFQQFLPNERIHCIPHGIDTAAFAPAKERTSLKRLLFVGLWQRDFITARKVMEAFKTIDKAVRLDVVTLPRYQAHFIGLDNVRVHCGISELELLGHYQRSAALFLPLKKCTFNNAIGEALACGLPVVTTDVGGVGDYVTEDCADLVASQDVDGCVETIQALLDNHDRRAAMSIAARNRAEALSWSNVNPLMTSLYRERLGSA